MDIEEEEEEESHLDLSTSTSRKVRMSYFLISSEKTGSEAGMVHTKLL
jgi:hypothetical protein